jgi:hypothetical protein
MTDTTLKKSTRGGARPGSGPKKDLRRQCEILAIANSWLVSESHARRIWEKGGLTPTVCTKSAALFTYWDDMGLEERKALHAILRAKTDENRAQGYTRK